MHPLGRIGEPADVAAAIAWLLDPATREVIELITTAATDFPAVTWSACSEVERRDLFWAIGRGHLAFELIARLRPELRAEAEGRVAMLDRSDPRGLGLLVERVIEDVRRDLAGVVAG